MPPHPPVSGRLGRRCRAEGHFCGTDVPRGGIVASATRWRRALAKLAGLGVDRIKPRHAPQAESLYDCSWPARAVSTRCVGGGRRRGSSGRRCAGCGGRGYGGAGVLSWRCGSGRSGLSRLRRRSGRRPATRRARRRTRRAADAKPRVALRGLWGSSAPTMTTTMTEISSGRDGRLRKNGTRRVRIDEDDERLGGEGLDEPAGPEHGCGGVEAPTASRRR